MKEQLTAAEATALALMRAAMAESARRAEAHIRKAQIADMPAEYILDALMSRNLIARLATAVLVEELRTRGYTVRRDELPACYPPMGDGDE